MGKRNQNCARAAALLGPGGGGYPVGLNARKGLGGGRTWG